jgi:hypothetical protein
MRMADYVAIKGARGGIRVVIDDACTWADALGDLHKQMQQGASLMQGMRIAINLGARRLEKRRHGCATEHVARLQHRDG